MAPPLTASQFLAALRAEGLKVVEVGDWRTHNRNHKGPWGEVHGIMHHHTVTGPKVDGVSICRNGFSELPGPLCHGVIRRDGSVHLVGYGRANHAGGGDPDVLREVTNEAYTGRPVAPNTHDGGAGAVDGNRAFYGFECENLGDGKDPWSAAQVEAMVRVGAALARAHKWSAKSVIAHKEWSDWKSDPSGPGMPTMPALRVRIDDRLEHAASWDPGDSPTPAPTTPSTGGTVPRRTYLSRPEGYGLAANTPQKIYWTTEHADDPGHHGGGGKTVLTDSTYSGTVHLQFDRLSANVGTVAKATVIPVREPQAGGAASNGPAAEVVFPAGLDTVTHSFAFTGEVGAGYNLVFEVESTENTVLTWAGVYLHSDPA